MSVFWLSMHNSMNWITGRIDCFTEAMTRLASARCSFPIRTHEV